MTRTRGARILTVWVAAVCLTACGDGGGNDGGGGDGPPGDDPLGPLTVALVEDLDEATPLDEATLLGIFPAPTPLAEPVISYAAPTCPAYEDDVADLTEFDDYTPPAGAKDKHLRMTVGLVCDELPECRKGPECEEVPEGADPPEDIEVPDEFLEYLRKGIYFGMQRWEEHHADFSLFDKTNPTVGGIPMRVVVDTDLTAYKDDDGEIATAAYVQPCANHCALPKNHLKQPVDKGLCEVELHVPYIPERVTNEDNDRRWMGMVSVATIVHEVAHVGQDYIQFEGLEKLLAAYNSGFDWVEEGHAMYLGRRSPDACGYTLWEERLCPIEILRRGAREWGNLPADAPGEEWIVPYTAGTFLDQITERAFGGKAGWMGDWFAFQITKPAVVLMIEAISEEAGSPHLDFHLFQRLFVESAMDLWIPLENLNTPRSVTNSSCYAVDADFDFATELPLEVQRPMPVISTDAVALHPTALPDPADVPELGVSLGIDRNPGNIRAAVLALAMHTEDSSNLFNCLNVLDEEDILAGGALVLRECQKEDWIVPLGILKPSNGHRLTIPLDPAANGAPKEFLANPDRYALVVILFNLLLGPDPDAVLETVEVTVRVGEPAGAAPAAEIVTATVEIPDFVVPFEPNLQMGYIRDIDGTDHPAVIASTAATYSHATDFNMMDNFTTLKLSLDATAIAGPGTYGCGDGTGGGLTFSTPVIGHERTSMTSNVLFLATGGTYTIETWGTETGDRVSGSFDCAVSGKRTAYSEDAGDFVSTDVEGTVAGTFDVSLKVSGTY